MRSAPLRGCLENQQKHPRSDYKSSGINQGSEASTGDAIKQRIVLSVRTDRRDALFVYTHDHLYNFV
uniref:Uncharacterized protein n=1 Tax=Parascaris equorum TaxID=6256 RepID=A0A914S5B5_PAREQ